jgi:hypothetical protein
LHEPPPLRSKSFWSATVASFTCSRLPAGISVAGWASSSDDRRPQDCQVTRLIAPLTNQRAGARTSRHEWFDLGQPLDLDQARRGIAAQKRPLPAHSTENGHEVVQLTAYHHSRCNLRSVAGKPNAMFKKIVSTMPWEQGSPVPADPAIDPRGLLPTQRAYYHYEGSLTTPPCSETVDWIVLTHPMEVDEDDIARFAKLFPMNARPV